jgi:transposase
MERTPLLPLPEGMLIDQIEESETSLRVTVIATHPTSCCPLCSEASSSIHRHYSRTLADVPCGGRQIRLCLTVRKFLCRNPRMSSAKCLRSACHSWLSPGPG